MRAEAYLSDKFPFAGNQRAGIRDALDGFCSIKNHISRASDGPFPRVSETPLRSETAQAAKFVASHVHHELAAFRGEHLLALDQLVSDAAQAQCQWNNDILPPISTASGGICTVALQQLAAHCGLGAEKWPGQCAVGLPIDGSLSQKRTFPAKSPKEHPVPRGGSYSIRMRPDFGNERPNRDGSTRNRYGRKPRIKTAQDGWMPRWRSSHPAARRINQPAATT